MPATFFGALILVTAIGLGFAAAAVRSRKLGIAAAGTLVLGLAYFGILVALASRM